MLATTLQCKAVAGHGDNDLEGLKTKAQFPTHFWKSVVLAASLFKENWCTLHDQGCVHSMCHVSFLKVHNLA